ncbi:MAG: ABC transporter permease [Lachnospiraceae bacterium]|nr:ABC transporter permease [Lachnospiraceae bacterium]
MGNVSVILRKQFKDTFKNKTVLIQFILFPVMTLIMENMIKLEGMPEHFFAKLFSVMYVGMAPLTCVASIISEEKEKNTLRVLIMSNVKPSEYLLGVGSYTWLLCMIGSFVIGASAKFTGTQLMTYEFIMGVGVLISILLGAAIGMYANNQMMSTSLVMPAMMLLAFAPMLSMFNEKIGKFAQILYTEQMSRLFLAMSLSEAEAKGVVCVLVNILVFTIFFMIAFREKGLE